MNEVLICADCGRKFAGARGLGIHRGRMHGDHQPGPRPRRSADIAADPREVRRLYVDASRFMELAAVLLHEQNDGLIRLRDAMKLVRRELLRSRHEVARLRRRVRDPGTAIRAAGKSVIGEGDGD